MIKIKRLGKGLTCGVLVLALSVGLALPDSGIVFADGEHGFVLDDSCVAASDSVADGLSCSFENVDYDIKLGSIAEDGGFRDYSEGDLVSVSYSQNKKAVVIEDENIVSSGYIHLYGDDSAVSAYADGVAMRFSGGNLAIASLDGHVFGLGAYQDNQGGDPGNDQGGGEEGYIGGQTVIWEYGSGEKQISGGRIALNSVCEPAWAYDPDAGPDEFMDCVEVGNEVDIAAYTITQNDRGGSLRVEPGIKLVFSIIPDEGYEYSDISMVVEPKEAAEHINGMGDDKGFEFVMPENADIRIVAYFEEKDETLGEIAVESCDGESMCDDFLPEIKSAKSDDAPDGVKIQISYGADDEEYEENWGSFALEIYGDVDKFGDFVDSLSDEDMESGKAVADALKKFGKILIENYDIHLINENTGERVEYEGNGIKVTLKMPEELDGILAALDEYYDGDYELVMAHLKSDGSVEYLPLTKNKSGAYTFTAKSLSPFGLVVRATATNPTPANNGSSTANNPVTLDKVMSYVVLGVASLAGLGVAGLAIRRLAKR